MSKETMLDNFVAWAGKFADKPPGKDTDAQVTVSEISDNPSARLDIDTPAAVARITCWESGDYHAEVLDFETEQTVFTETGCLCNGDALTDKFAGFLKSIGIHKWENT